MPFARTAAIMILIGVLALGVGWLAPGRPPAPLRLTRYPRTAPATALTSPAAAASAALADLDDEIGQDGVPSPSLDPDALAARNLAPAPPRPPAPTPPPPPDVGVVFHQAVRAVVEPRPGQGLYVLLRDPASATGQSRLLGVGDKFEGRWRLAELSMSEAVLRNGDQVRRVSLFGGVGGG